MGILSSQRAKISTFSMAEYRISEGTIVQDYFKRFDWPLSALIQLSNILDNLYVNYIRAHNLIMLSNF